MVQRVLLRHPPKILDYQGSETMIEDPRTLCREIINGLDEMRASL